MTAPILPTPDPSLDLVLERKVAVPRERLWRGWTEPELLKKWFTPAPWATVECEVDLRPGGIFRTVMRSPEGQEFAGAGCYLAVAPNERLVWTSALAPGFRPLPPPAAGDAAGGALSFTAAILLEPLDAGTRYTARVMHGDADAREKHAAMGFHEGWGKALDQLVALARTL